MKFVRAAYLSLAMVALVLAFLGALLPLLPTTPFLLIAAWAAPRGSERLDAWLHEHPRFGPVLIAWETRRAVSLRAKCMAIALMSLSWVIMFLKTESWVVPTVTGVLFVSVGTYLATRPRA